MSDLVKIWKSFNSETDVGISGLFERAYHASTRSHSLKLSIPRCQTKTLRRSFGVRCANLWNSLPREVVKKEYVWVQDRFRCVPVGQVI